MSVEQLVERTDKLKTGKAHEERINPKASQKEEAEVYTRVFINKEGLGAQEEKSTIDIKPMRVFLEDATANVLNIINKQKPGQNPNIIPPHVRRIVDIITDGNPNLSPTELKQKVGEKLQSDELKMLTRMWQDEQLTYKSFALGFHWATDPEADRKAMATEETIHTGTGEGKVHKGLRHTRDFISSHPQLQAMLTGLAAASGGGYLTLGATGSPELAAIASGGILVAGGMVGGVNALWHSANTPGEREIKSFCSASLRMMQDPDKAAYIKAMSGIDVNDFVAGPNNEITLKPGRIPESTRVAAVEKEVKQGVTDRRKFWKDLTGEDNTDAMSNQFLYRSTTGQQEQTGSRMSKRIQEIFKPNEGGIQDIAHQSAENPFFGREAVSVNPSRRINFPTWAIPGTDPDMWGNLPTSSFYGRNSSANFPTGAILGTTPDIWGNPPTSEFYGKYSRTPNPLNFPGGVVGGIDSFGNTPSSMFYGICSREAYTRTVAGSFDARNLRRTYIPGRPRLDQWGQLPDDPYYGRTDGRRAHIGSDVEGNLRRYDDAYKQAMLEQVELVATEIRKGNFKKDVTVITEKKAEREKPDGRVYKQKAEAIDKKIESITQDRDRITPEQQTQVEYKGKLKVIEDSRKALNQELKNLTKAGTPYTDNLTGAITDLEDFLNIATTSGGTPIEIRIGSRRIRPIPDLLDDIDTREGSQLGHITYAHYPIGGKESQTEWDARLAGYRNEVRRRAQESRDKVNTEQRKEIEEEIKKLRGLQEQIDEAQQETEDPKYEKVLSEREQDVNSLIDPRSRTGTAHVWNPPVNENDLRHDSVEEILRKINRGHTITTTAGFPNPLVNSYGWPESENNRPEHRQQVLRAMAEARARQADPNVNTEYALTHEPDFATVTSTAAGGYGITENQLHTLTPEELIVIVDRAGIWTPAITGALDPAIAKKAQIEAAQNVAKSRRDARVKSTDQLVKVLDDAETTQKELKDKIPEELQKEKDQLQITAELMNNVDKVYDLAQQIILKPSDYLEPVIPVRTGAAAGKFTNAEFDLGAPAGYYAILDSMFTYKKTAKREETIGRITRALPPGKMSELLSDSLGLGTGNNIENTLIQMDARLSTNPPTLDYAKLQEAFEHIVQTLYNEGIALS